MGIDSIAIVGIILIIFGFILVGIEMVVPGFSLPGISGIICLMLGVFMTADSFAQGAMITIIILILMAVMLATILWFFSKGKIKSPIVLEEEQKKTKGFLSSSDLNYLCGKEGVAVTDLHPSGMGDFEDVQLDVISEGKYISKGTKLIIKKVEGSKLIVKEIK